MQKQGIKLKFTFKSDTVANKSYQTIWWEDDSSSCNCFGWVRRVAADGTRSCKHTIKLKTLHPEVKSRTEPYRTEQTVNVTVPANVPVTVTARHGTKVTVTARPSTVARKRKFNWDA